jgi:hypothetical protein
MSRRSPLADVRLAASTSFTAEEVDGLGELFATLLRGGDARLMMRSPIVQNVIRKITAMKSSIARQRERRADIVKEQATEDGRPAWDEPCTHPDRNGNHEPYYLDGRTTILTCKACGAKTSAPEAKS